MKFEFLKFLISPFALLFLVLSLGTFVGKLQIKKFKLGISGALFVGLFAGWGVIEYAMTIGEGSEYYSYAQKAINNGLINGDMNKVFLYIFITAVGLMVSKDLGKVLKSYGSKFIILSAVITLFGAGLVLTLRPYIGSGTYEMSGVYTAALTSSPGFATALETTEHSAKLTASKYETFDDETKAKILKVIDSDGELTPENTPTLSSEQEEKFVKEAAASTGAANAVGFPIGVITVILSMNLIPKIFRIDLKKEEEEYVKELEMMNKKVEVKDIKPVKFDLVAFALPAFIGFAVGYVKIYFGSVGYYGLGTTGGVLLMSLLAGHLGKVGSLTFRMDEKVLGAIKELSLRAFVGTTGVLYGHKVFSSFTDGGLTLLLMSLLVAIACILIGFIVGKYVLKINWFMLSGAICGGMTSTPGLGAAVDSLNHDAPGAGYAATYPFALVGVVMFTIILNNLPL